MADMKKTAINDSFSLEIPEGFQVMGPADFQSLGKKAQENDWAIQSKEKHLILETGWKKIPFLAGGVGTEQVAKNTERQISGQIPTYKKVQDRSRTIGGEKAFGFRYTYTASGIDMTAEYMVLKHNKFYYFFSCLGRTEIYDRNYDAFSSLLDSVELR